MTPSAPIVHVEHLGREYRGCPALIDLNFDVYPGRIVGPVGPNGCGKTALLKVLAGALTDWSGTITVDGGTPRVDIKRHAALLPSTGFLGPRLTLLAAVKLYARFFEDFDADKALSSVRFFGLPPDHKLREMSKDMGGKLRIYPTMARKACLYLLDELVSRIDPATRGITLEGTLRNFDEGMLMLISAHLISDVEPILDEVVMLKGGRVRRAASVDDLREECGVSLDALFRKEYRWCSLHS